MAGDKNEEVIAGHNCENIASHKVIENTPESEYQNILIREAMYAFLSTVFLQPVGEDFLRQICDRSFLYEFTNLFYDDASIELEQYLSSLKPSLLTGEVDKLKREYMSLFAVPTGRYVAPFEDIYRGKSQDGQVHRGPLLGVRAIAAQRLYRESGAQMDNMCKELPNHIGVELSYMRFLCERQANSLSVESMPNQLDEKSTEFSQMEIYRTYQIRFLAEHLTHWFPMLNEEIQAKSTQVFYQIISNLTQEFLVQDLEKLKLQVLINLQSVN